MRPPPSAEFAAKSNSIKKKASASHKTAAAVTAGSDIKISGLARLGGIRYATSISAGLGLLYRLSPDGPVWDRLEVFDLLWAVRAGGKQEPGVGVDLEAGRRDRRVARASADGRVPVPDRRRALREGAARRRSGESGRAGGGGHQRGGLSRGADRGAV